MNFTKVLRQSALHFGVAITGLLVSLTSIYAQTLTLDNVLSRIEHNNPQLASFQYKMKAANSLVSGARAWAPPVAGIGFDQTPYSVASDETFFNRNEGSALIFVQQEFPNISKLRAKENYLASLASIDSSECLFTRNQLFTQAKTAYVERFIAEKRSKIVSREIELLNLIIQSSMNEYTSQQGDLPSIYKAQARMHTLEAMLEHEASAAKEATVKLNYLMNLPQSTVFRIDTAIQFKEYKLADLDTSSSFISFQRSDVQKAEYKIASFQLNNALILSAGKPDFGLRYEHYDMFGSRNTFSLMGYLTIPIAPWSSKSYRSQSVSTQQEIEAMNFEKQNLILQSRSEMQSTLLHTIAEYSEVNHFEKEVLPAYRKAFETSLLAYRENTGSLIFSLMAWDDLNMAQMEYLYHLEQAYKSEIAYENAIEKR